MPRTWLATFIVTGLLAAPTVAANKNTTIVLHAQPIGNVINCDQWIGNVDCSPELPPTINVGPGEPILVHIFLRNYDDASALFCKLSVDGGEGAQTWGDWTFHAASLSCLLGQTDNGPGPLNGNMHTTFACLTGGDLRLVGYLVLTSGSHGCLRVEEHDIEGTGVWDCSGGIGLIQVAPQNRGRICVGVGGYNACDPQIVPVESATWGRIKKQYQ
jgi:hypothetical protein